MSKFARSRVSLAASAVAALALGLASAGAYAVDFDGYFRAGPGATSKNDARACYNLGISGGHYRLGNECDFYGEFGLAQTGTTADGVSWKAKVMFNQYNPGTDTGDSSSGFNQMYVEGKGFDIAPGTNFWAGKRFYGRKDVHIVDQFFTKLDGVGAGFDQTNLGFAKLGVSYFTTDGGNTGLSHSPGGRINVDMTEIGLGDVGGQLRVLGTFTEGRFDGATGAEGTSGFGLTVQHTIDIASVGGGNTVWLQYAQGSAGLDGNFGNLTAPSGTSAWRLVESFTWQAGPFGGQAIALYGQQDANPVSGAAGYDELSIGGRGSFAITNHFKLVAEAGYMEKNPDGSAKQKLAKFTLAPTLSTGPGFWNRPELRLYVTTAKWNQPANDANGIGGLTGLGNGKTKGTSWGAQAEVWF
ncbi:MAG TPA: carbohydrate porin [Rhizobacter sp.]|nr:carbohydrate porin [Rhizobacter sp.]